jgi:hypothetical protein
MWLFTTDGFLSVVSKGCRSDQLMVRARVKADLKRAFPKAKITSSKATDYRFRAVITRKALAAYLGRMVERLAYSNFKDTVKDDARHHAYLRVWNAMYGLQERPTADRLRRVPGTDCHLYDPPAHRPVRRYTAQEMRSPVSLVEAMGGRHFVVEPELDFSGKSKLEN